MRLESENGTAPSSNRCLLVPGLMMNLLGNWMKSGSAPNGTCLSLRVLVVKLQKDERVGCLNTARQKDRYISSVLFGSKVKVATTLLK